MRKALLFALVLFPMLTWAQTLDSVSQAKLDSIDAKMQLMKLKEISISAPKPVYSMTGEVVNYNVENDETVRDLTAWDAIRNAPTVQVDEEGNLTMRGSDHVDVWLNGRPTGMNGPTLKAFFESMPAEALARIEVIKNPSAKYMVEEGHHIVNIVTSARLRTSELWLLGLSGNTRPYLSPWFSYVRNTDRLKFSFHLAGSHSHFSDVGDGSSLLIDGNDTTIRNRYSTASSSASYNGNNNINIDCQIDSLTDLNIMSWNSLQGRYNNFSASHYEQWDYLPDTAHYRYTDTSSTHRVMFNGFTIVDIKRRLPGAKGHNLTFGGVWNYLIIGSGQLQQRLLTLAEGNATALLLQPYDRTCDVNSRHNSLSLSLRYNRPVGEHDEFSVRLGGTPYGIVQADRTIFGIDPTGAYTLPDTLRNYISDYRSRKLYLSLSWRHEWERFTLSADLHASQDWLSINNRGLFADDTAFRFFALEPSFGLTYRTPSMHYFRFNVSHNTSTPSGSDVTISRTYSDDSYTVGNRALRKSYTEKASLSWNRYFEKIGSMGVDAYANYTFRGIESITASTPLADEYLGRVIAYSMPFNIASSYKVGADANITYRPAAWASLSLNASLYRQAYQVEGEAPQELTSWQLYARLWSKVAKVVNLDANVSYGNPTLGLYSQSERAVSVGIGASATLCDGRLSLRVNISDLFDNNLNQMVVNAPSYASTESSHSRWRYVTFGITWRIGKLDLEWQARGGAAAQ